MTFYIILSSSFFFCFFFYSDAVMCSLVPRPLPDFVSQPWRKIGHICKIKSGSGLGMRLVDVSVGDKGVGKSGMDWTCPST